MLNSGTCVQEWRERTLMSERASYRAPLGGPYFSFSCSIVYIIQRYIKAILDGSCLSISMVPITIINRNVSSFWERVNWDSMLGSVGARWEIQCIFAGRQRGDARES